MAPAADGLIKDITTQSFMKDVIEESKNQPVLIDFWAPWCGPCKQLTPILEKAVKAARGKVKLVKMDIDKYPEIPGQMGIQSIPAVIAFVNGQPADGFMGAIPESQVTAFIDKLTKGAGAGPDGGPSADDIADAMLGAEALLKEGDASSAAQIFAQILSLEPEHAAASGGLARAHLAAKEIDKAKDVLKQLPEAKRNDPAVTAALAAIDLAEQAASVGPLGELEQKVAADTADHQARFDLAVALNAANRRTEAATHLLEIVRRDRKWNEDGARKKLVQFFEAWGPTDEATIDGRKRLSSVLFS
jgi:putative thioredoxin